MKSNTRIMALDRRVSAAMALAAAAALILLLFTGCEENPFAKGSEIKFQAGSGPATKTEYGEIVGTGADKVQRVDWLSGDQLRICCAATSAPSSKYADYRIKEGTITTSGALTKAKITPVGSGLQWGSTSDAHNFYGLYPSPATGKTGDAIDKDGKMQGKIPATQTPDEVVIPEDASKPIVAKPVMTNQYMVAKATKAAGVQTIADDEVVLYFTPITTAIEFTVKNNYEDNQTLRIKSVSLISTSHNLSGSFSTDLLNDWSGTYPTTASGTFSDLTKEVKIDFTGETDGFVSLEKGNMLNFTFFLLPNTSPDDLVFKIVKQKADGEESDSYMKAAIVDKDGTGIEFDRCKKHFVSGVLLEDGAVWTVGFDPDVFSWDVLDPVDKTLEDPTAAEPSGLVSWDTGDEDDLELKAISYEFKLENPGDATKTFSNPTETSSYDIPVTSVKSEGVTTDENHGWTVKSYKVGSGSPVTVTGNTFTVEGLTVEKDGKKLKVTDGRTAIDKGGNAYWRNTGARTDNLDWSPASWSGTIDLSKNDVLSNDSEPVSRNMRTANCYIVRHAGTYKIPLVYGNAIDYGKSGLTNGNNTDAYAPGGSGSYRLTSFVNHLGNGIFDPYIENNTSDGNAKTKKGNSYITANKAEVIWADATGVITISSTSYNGIDIAPKAVENSSGKYAADYNSNTVRYIQFTVNQANIQQCNAVIAVKDASNNILWSWHIWITNDPAVGQAAIPAIPFINNTNKTYNFFPVPCIGWIEPPFYDEKDDVVVTLQQEESGDTLEITVKRPSYRVWGNGTYYQFGRKDPMPDVTKSVLPSSYQSNVNMKYASKQSLAESIKNPGRFGFGSNVQESWCSANYNNLWTGKTTATGGQDQNDNMIKTVYDPSPVGYKAPASNAFTGFTKDGSNSTSSSNWNYDGTAIDVLHGYNFTKSSYAIFFSAAGYYKPESSGLVLHGDTSTGRVDATPIDVGGYWSALPMSNSEDGTGVNNGSRLFFQSDRVNPVNSTARCWGFSIRPVTE